MKAISIPKNKARGATLIISLIMLLLLTIIGISGASNISLVERITGNLSDKTATKQTCEMALRQEETYLSSLLTLPTPAATPSNTSAIWALGAASGSTSLDSTWMKTAWPTAALTASNATSTTYFTEQEEMRLDSMSVKNDYASGGRPGTYYYRNSAATLSTRVASTICQSTFAKRFN